MELVDDLLEKTQEYATIPQDCYRFVFRQTNYKGYVKAKYLVDFDKKE
jgi:hypothetical protein